MRIYEPQKHDSDNWILWRWRLIFTPGSLALYLRRLYLLRTPWFSVMLHWLKQPDSGRWLHDHPWRFFSIVLRGFYREQVEGGGERVIRWLNWKPLDAAHRIVAVAPSTITLVITGPKRHKWGFYTDRGFVYWREYLAVEHQ